MPDFRVPFTNLKAHHRALEGEIREAVDRVLASGRYILGSEVESFEREFAGYLGAGHCVSVASGTDAVALALRACGIAAGDEVITVSHSAVATVAAIEQAGAKAVFADIDPVTRCLDHRLIPSLVSEKTKAVVPVHIYGHPCSMKEIMDAAARHGLKVIEDCAQAHGAELDGRKAGCFGDAAAFSFYPTKNLGAFGDGGAVVTGSGDVCRKLRALREYGWQERHISSSRGVNSRLDEIQAAVLRVKLGYLDAWNDRRRLIAARYAAAADGAEIIPPATADGARHAWHLYVIECGRRDGLQMHLHDGGIETMRHYPRPIHLQPAYREQVRGHERLPNTERLYARILSLPMYPELTDAQVETVAASLGKWMARG